MRVTSNVGWCTQGDPSDPTNWMGIFSNGNFQGVLIHIEQPYAWVRIVGGDGPPTAVEYALNGVPLYFGDCSHVVTEQIYSVPWP